MKISGIMLFLIAIPKKKMVLKENDFSVVQMENRFSRKTILVKFKTALIWEIGEIFMWDLFYRVGNTFYD